jgi:hypothetical protein
MVAGQLHCRMSSEAGKFRGVARLGICTTSSGWLFFLGDEKVSGGTSKKSLIGSESLSVLDGCSGTS